MASVYALVREDLQRAYVGQSLVPQRRHKRHELAKDYYVYEEMWESEIAPEFMILERGIERGKPLDEAEWRWMDSVKDAGWTLINRLPSGVVWGSSEQVRIVASLGGKASTSRDTSAARAAQKAHPETRRGGGGDARAANAYWARNPDKKREQLDLARAAHKPWTESRRAAQSARLLANRYVPPVPYKYEN